MEKIGTAGGAIEAALFQQVGSDPNQPNAERDAQIGAVAEIIATFVQAASATLDVAIYDFCLSGAAANRVRSALNDRAAAGVKIRILFDSATASGQGDEPGNDLAAGGTAEFLDQVQDHVELKASPAYSLAIQKNTR